MVRSLDDTRTNPGRAQHTQKMAHADQTQVERKLEAFQLILDGIFWDSP